ncbi:hypothetical protein AB4212_65920, partial [Streptomyces sp. 2MCAF27]
MFSNRPSNSSAQRSRSRTRTRTRTGVRAAALTVPLAIGGVLAAAVPPAQAAPAQARASATHHNGPSQCRGEGVDTGARIRYQSDVVIKAPLSTVFKLQTDVERWPAWQPPVLTMKRLDPG